MSSTPRDPEPPIPSNGTNGGVSPSAPAEHAATSPRRDLDALLPEVYEDLRKLAAERLRGEARDHTLQPTALAHETYLRLAAQRSSTFVARTTFLSAAAGMIRRILVDHARARKAAKRGGGAVRVPIEDLDEPRRREVDVLSLDEALQHLARLNARQARVVELRFYGGLSGDESADVLGVSPRTVDNDWRVARAWLRGRLAGVTA